MSDERRVPLFRIDGDQALRIPRDFELPGTEAILHREGFRLIVEPTARPGLLALLAKLKPLAEDFPAIEDSDSCQAVRSATEAFRLLASLPEDFMAEGRQDPPPEDREPPESRVSASRPATKTCGSPRTSKRPPATKP